MAVDSGRRILFISYILITIFPCLTNAQPEPQPEWKEFERHYCNKDYTQTYDSSSVFGTNLGNLTSILDASSARFYNFSIGQDPDTVYVIALCRGDVAMNICSTCLRNAYTSLRKSCLNEKQSIIWYDHCMLRYWDQPIFHMRQSQPNDYAYNWKENVSNALSGQYKQAVGILLEDLLDVASKNTSVQKFATGKITIGPDNNKITIYALAECTPDLSRQDCRDCLEGTREKLPTCCDERLGARVIYPSCNFRYEKDRFYSLSTNEINSKLLQPPVTGTRNRNNIVIIVIAAIIFLVLVIACIWIIMRKRKQKKKINLLNENEGGSSLEISSVTPLRFEFDIIKDATDDFSDTNKLGQGGFGDVYKGRLPDRRHVAVKRLSQASHQGEEEFKNEVLLMANLQHRNLVKLLGFCQEGTERLLIYEFIANGSLDQFIFDSEKRRYLNRSRRYKIIEGIARGLLYLHEDYSSERIIHRDLKASNILLDADMNPKIADFGIARMFCSEVTNADTNIVIGTIGYMAPEYRMLGKFSVKSDVFSFGVLVLEIISGHKNSHSFGNEDSAEYILSYAWKNWQEGTHSKFIDPTLLDASTSMSDILRCIHIGLLCVQENAVDRPTMASVVIMLNSKSYTLELPSKPSFFGIDQQSSQGSQVMLKSEHSVNEISITELSGR